MPLPTHPRTFPYDAVVSPVLSANPSQAKPIGVGAIATGGNTFDISIGLDQFAGPVDVFFAIYASSIDATNVYFLNSGYSLQTTRDHEGRSVPRRSLVWKTSVLDVTEAIALDVPVSALPPGQYTLILQVSPTASGDDDINTGAYDRWITSFTIQSNHRSDD
jgi:hypothetical protein